MLGLIGTVGGAAALELRRLRNKGSVQELQKTKKAERELRTQLEHTARELEQVRAGASAAEARAQELADKAAAAEREAGSLKEERTRLQQNNSKLVLNNLMLLTKSREMEEQCRALVARQDDLTHQLEQMRREREAAEARLDASLAALKERVTGVLSRYLSKDLELTAALGELRGMGIEVVAPEALARATAAGASGGGDGSAGALQLEAREFETKLVLDSPHRMQRLMSAAAAQRAPLQLLGGGGGGEAPMVNFPLAVSIDAATGAPRLTLGWRAADPQVPRVSAGGADAPPDLPQDQATRAAVAACTDAASSSSSSGSSGGKAGGGAASPATQGALKAAVVAVDARAGGGRGGGAAQPAQALEFSSPKKAPKRGSASGGGGGGGADKQKAGFSLGFGSLAGRIGRGSSGGGAGGRAPTMTTLIGAGEDELPLPVGGAGGALALRP